MHTEIITIPCLDDNYAYIIHNHKRNETFLIDAPESSPIIKTLEKNSWKLKKIIITHHHSDHIMGINDLKKKYNPIIVGADSDSHRLPTLGEKIKVNQILNLGDLKFEVIDTPGHTIGHIAIYCKELSVVFTGDSLMVFGCGRLFEGTPETMWETLNKFKKLPEETKVYSGHEYAIKNAEFAVSVSPNNKKVIKRYNNLKKLIKQSLPSTPSTIKEELETNPFLRANNLEMKKSLNMDYESNVNVFAKLRNLRDSY